MAKTPISAEDLRRVLEAAVDTGKATGGSANTLVDTTKSWPVNAWVDLVVDITNGTGQGQIRRLASNTANTLTISTNWDTVPDASSEYEIKFFSTISGTITVADIEKWGGTVITGRDISLDFAELPVIRDILGTTALSTIQEISDDVRTAVQSVDGNVVEIKNILGTTALSTIQEIEDDILTAVLSMDGKIPSDPSTVTEQQVVQSILGTTVLSTIQEIENNIKTAVESIDAKTPLDPATEATLVGVLSGTDNIPTDPATVTEQQVIQSILGTTALSTIQEIEDDILTAVESVDSSIDVDLSTRASESTSAGVLSVLGTTALSTIQEIEDDILTAVQSIDGKIPSDPATESGNLATTAGATSATAGSVASVDTKMRSLKTPIRVAISAAGIGDNTLVAAVVANKIKVLSIALIAAAAVDVRFESGAGGAALTGVMSLAANGGFVVSPPADTHDHWIETAVNTLLNLELSAAVQVSGFMTYYEEA